MTTIPPNNRRRYIERTLVLSTAHWPSWAPHFGGFATATYDTGALVYVPLDDDGVPGWLVPIFAVARAERCSYVRFDCDAYELDTLQTYNW